MTHDAGERPRTTDEQLSEFDPWLAVCGLCDGGLPMGCTHPEGDYRVPMLQLRNLAVAERDRADRLQEQLDEERYFHNCGGFHAAHE